MAESIKPEDDETFDPIDDAKVEAYLKYKYSLRAKIYLKAAVRMHRGTDKLWKFKFWRWVALKTAPDPEIMDLNICEKIRATRVQCLGTPAHYRQWPKMAWSRWTHKQPKYHGFNMPYTRALSKIIKINGRAA